MYKALLNGVQEVAVKIFFDVHTAREEADILREVAILKGCRDRNVVQFYGACLEVRVLLWVSLLRPGLHADHDGAA